MSSNKEARDSKALSGAGLLMLEEGPMAQAVESERFRGRSA